MSIITN